MNCTLAETVVDALRQVLGNAPLALHEPRFGGNEWAYLKDCLDSTFVSSVGKYVDRFEAELAAYTGARHAVAVVNGTAALHVALLLAKVCPGDEVLVPALTFAATANAVIYCGAVPHFVDSEVSTLGIDVAALREHLSEIGERRDGRCINRRSGRPITALVPMHTFGHPGDLDGLLAVARDYGIALIEDAAESLGSTYHGRHTGTFGLAGVLSFNGNKTITTGGGGALLTDDAEIAKRAKHLTTTAKLPHRWEYRHDEVGFNYRMPNLNAALGCAQLEQLDCFLASKRSLHAAYARTFTTIDGVALVEEPAGTRSNYWLQVLLLAPELASLRDEILGATNDAGLMTRPAWVLMHELAHFSNCPRMNLEVATGLAARLINIPSSAGLVGVNA
ncbi:LegC family aminotransferase [Sphingorhabdus sp.]|uniref:LegC family aminotransferase n=1 Tax=Sphingorhabdus sp. TaxID=1902408 RepID=UPI0035AE0085